MDNECAVIREIKSKAPELLFERVVVLFSFFVLLVSMGLIDSLNPFSIAAQIFLLGVINNINRIGFYVLGVLLVYFFGGIFIFSDLPTVISELHKDLSFVPLVDVYILKSTLGLILIIYGVHAFKKNQQTQSLEEKPDLSNWTLAAIGGGGTLADLPTAIPYLGIIDEVTEMGVNIFFGSALLLVYNLIYILPLLIIWALYFIYKDNAKAKLAPLANFIIAANKYFTTFFCVVIGAMLVADFVLYCLGSPINWQVFILKV